MKSEERNLINTLIAEISQLRGEMKEFKEQIVYRLGNVESRCEERQANPESCSIGRALEKHTSSHRARSEGGRGNFMLILEVCVLAVMVISVIWGR